MSKKNLDLAGIFQSVTDSLIDHQDALNRADDYNQNHGDNMVQAFQTITGALEKKKTSSASSALSYAAKQLSKTSTGGSSQLYAQNLATAASAFKGKKVDDRGALELLQTLIGGGQAQAAQSGGGDDLLGSLLGGLSGGGQTQSAQSSGGDDLLGSLLGGLTGGGQTQSAQSSGGDDLLGSLLGGLTGGGQAQSTQSSGGDDLLGSLLGGLGGGSGSSSSSQGGSGFNLLNAALAFFQAKQSGQGGFQALVQAFTAGNRMGGTTHRNQSTEVVVNSFLQALQSSKNK